jgi:hypothetical protein
MIEIVFENKFLKKREKMFVYFLLIRTAAPRAPSITPRTGAGLSAS